MKSLLRLRPYLKAYWPLILVSVLLAIPLAALRAGQAPAAKYVLATLNHPDQRTLIYLSLGVIGWYIVNFFVRFFHYYCIRVVIGRVNQRLKNDLFTHLQGLSSDYFSEQKNGVLISRVGQDPNNVDAGIGCITDAIREPLTFVVLLGYTVYLNWKLTLVTFLVFPPMALVFRASGRNLKRYISRIQESNGEIFATLQESFAGFRVIQMFRLEKYVRKKFRERTEQFMHYYLKTALLEEAAHPAIELLISVMIAGVLYYGGMQILNHHMSFEELMSFYVAFALMMDPVRRLNEINMKLHQAAGACERIFTVFDWKTHLFESPSPKRLAPLKDSIVFKNVQFAYPDQPDRKILQGISFEVKKGQVVALVGESGAGKSSLVTLLPRIFDINSGSIELDGINIQDFDLDSLRSQVAVVSQEVFLFNDTIEENIRCGRFSASKEELLEAARRAHALDYIDRLPNGLKTQIGDRGQKLSGGERQRLSIARAFLKNASILILDEATSSLDNVSETIVQDALEQLMVAKTTLVIAHRLSTIQKADCILVVRNGQIVERGKHDELLRAGGEYARLANSQFNIKAATV